MKLKSLLKILIVPLLLFADMTSVHAMDSDPSVTEGLYSDYAILLDAQTNQVISERGADERIYPASMTKMMTAIVAIESVSDLYQTVTITDEMLDGLYEMNASVAGFMTGDSPTVLDLLYGVALPSGADACHALAYYISGSEESFVRLMNQKAAELGMANTSFMNTSGLDDENHYTTVREMAVLLQYCIQNETFCDIFSTASYVTSPLASYPGGMPMSSTIWSTVDSYGYYMPGFIGGKTGFTYIAGHCLAYWAELNGMKLIGVTAHADTDMYEPSHIDDASTVLVRMENWQRSVLLEKDQVIHTVTVHHKKSDETIEVRAPLTEVLDIPADESVQMNCTIPAEVNAGLHEEKLYGNFSITQGDRVLYSEDLAVVIPREKSGFARFVLWLRSIF